MPGLWDRPPADKNVVERGHRELPERLRHAERRCNGAFLWLDGEVRFSSLPRLTISADIFRSEFLGGSENDCLAGFQCDVQVIRVPLVHELEMSSTRDAVRRIVARESGVA